VNDQTLAVTVEQIIGGGAAQPLAHRPDMGVDDAPAERAVERLYLDLRLSGGWRWGIHGGALTVGATRDPHVAPSRQTQMLAQQGAEAKLM
jgi:hypothetical protein